jgi:hypothetical protein
MKRALDIPPETEGDDRATEMIRVWLAHNDLHVSMLLGMWSDAEDSEVDERDAWGQLLADLTRHIANGMMKEYGGTMMRRGAASRRLSLAVLMTKLET